MDKDGRDGDDFPAFPAGEITRVEVAGWCCTPPIQSFHSSEARVTIIPTPSPLLEGTMLPTETLGPAAKMEFGSLLRGGVRKRNLAPPGVLQSCFGPFCAQVNIPEKERDLIRRSSSKGPLTRAIFHSAKVTLFPILMYFWRRYLSIPSLPRWRRLWGCHPLSPAPCFSATLEVQMRPSPGAQLESCPWSVAVSGVSHTGSASGR